MANYMANYILRDIDDTLWRRVKARAATDGLTLRALLLAMLRAYVAGTVTITGITAANR